MHEKINVLKQSFAEKTRSVSAAEADCARQLAKLMPQFKSMDKELFCDVLNLVGFCSGLGEEKEKLLAQSQEEAKTRQARRRDEEARLRSEQALSLEARLREMRENAASETAAAALAELRANSGKSARIGAFRRWEAAVETERRQRIAARDAKTQALEERAREALELRSEQKTALLEAIQNKLVSATSSSASSSVVEEVGDVDAAKQELEELRARLEQARTKEAEKEASRKMVENGVRENFARKAQQLDDAEAALADGGEEEEEEKRNDSAVLEKGEKILAKRKATDTEWLPGRVEYATSDGKYLVSFDHNKSRMLCAANLVKKAEEDNSRRATKELVSKSDEQKRKIEASRQAAVEVAMKELCANIAERNLFFCRREMPRLPG